ncbi:PREDICTED: semaphorin-1A isoform X2 [Nicrophorus vespilloides]|uniref:Semaphorin-1A isoform X2 n=1 Tax=Nicrophorus vespilloides TaxID=110193 RepID=A0ABM1NE98_NICVS|nr:PREDICTED: semaphorin-1A isoform X2 [Nicrophorus vespilloides]
MRRVLFVVAACCAFSACLAAWQENVRPKMYVQLGAEDDVHRFQGNDTYTDFFRLVMRDGDSLLVGGRNLVYNLSMSNLVEQQRLTWFSNDQDVKMCVMKGKDEENCQNYIRIMTKSEEGRLLLCGTNSFKPVCREYNVLSGNYTMEKEKPGQAVCPYDPHHNSTAIYVDGDLYTGTVADFSGMDPIIYREPLQTEQYDSMSLNAPDFVNSMTQGDFVYFFFRETAVEYINCGKAVYSRVARVCKYDRGGPHRFRNRWTSFLKSRLNCSVTGDFPFYFNEIQSTTELIEGKYGDVSAQLVYGTFTTPPNSITGSAVCAFSLQDIADTFEGNFKEQPTLNSNWLPVQSSKVPDPRPGQCHNDSRTLPDLTLNFIKTHSLMDESVPNFFGQPIVIRTSFHYRFTQIAVDPQIKVPGGKTYDVLFIGTDNGKVIKAVNGLSAESRHGVRPVVIEEIQVFPSHVAVRGIKVIRNEKQEGRLIVVADGEVQSLRLHRCDSSKISSCSECVALQDPYCAWDKLQGKCRSHGAGRWGEENYFFQSVSNGQHSACPPMKLNKDAGSLGGLSTQPKYNQDHQASKEQPDGQIINIVQDKVFENNDPGVRATESLPPQYSVETLVTAVVAGAVCALLVGFIAGYLCGRKCHKDEDDNMPYPDTEYEYFEQRQNMNRIQAEPKLLPQEEVTYAEPVLVPQPPKLHSPKSTLRKMPQLQNNAETLFQFQTDTGYNGRDYRTRDNFGTLRSHQGDNNYRRGDGFATTRSVKKVYL